MIATSAQSAAFAQLSAPLIKTTASTNSAFAGRSLSSGHFPTRIHQPQRPQRNGNRFFPTSVATDVDKYVTEPSEERAPVPTPVLNRPFGPIVDLLRRDSGNLIYSPKYGPVYKSQLIGKPITIVSDIKAIVEIYNDSDTFVSSDGAWPATFESLFGPKTLFIIDGEKHEKKRAVVQPAFTPTFFPSYFAPILQSSRLLWDQVSADLETNKSTTLLSLLKEHYLRIIIRITTGLDVSKDNREEFLRLRELYVNLESGFYTVPFGPIWKKALSARENLLDFYERIIRERLVRDAVIIDRLRESGDGIASVARKYMKGGAIDMLTVAIARSPLKRGNDQELDPVELNEIAELMMLLWFAGYSTQATTTSSCVLQLGLDESIRTQLKAEQDALMASSGTDELTVTQVMREMPLLDSYVNEIMRLYPALATFPRRVMKDTMICGHLVKKGSTVGMDFWGAQRDPQYFKNGDEIMIDRFMGRDAPMTVTFGSRGGSHHCLGEALAMVNVKTTIAVLLREYDMELDQRQSRKYVSFPTIQPVSGVKAVKCKRKAG